MSIVDDYRDGDVIQLLVPGDRIGSLMDEWMYRGAEADVRVRRAKTKGHVVIETRHLMYACYVVKNYAGVRVDIKKTAR